MTNLRNLRIPLAIAAVAITSVFVLSSWTLKIHTPHGMITVMIITTLFQKRKKRSVTWMMCLMNLTVLDLKMDMEKNAEGIK